ncbi:sensor domain-containing diguanylate cyclase [Shewanella gelidimarina]|uniref:sensor domain-containing diguanylate cyclase n=1 Tax=Shewanella gelidimarina TaxID=56813 RepID=UPI00200D1634|nr:sensor domain-containing diguanylate cyclase [Shewanella gelidimarina]MCL1058901.1 sensor domain-containing diguanylate cyclase [Shewanella gelidimarina]
MSIKDSLKKKKIDALDLKTHLALLGVPLLLLFICWIIFFSISANQNSVANLLLISIIYLLGYSLNYYFHQGRLSRLWEHLLQVVHVNETTFELVNIANQYQDETAFLNALLNKAVSCIDGAEMGTIIRVEHDTGSLSFESAVGIDINKLRQLNIHLEQSFEYRITKGKCDRVVVIDDMEAINAHSSLSASDQDVLLEAPSIPIRSTLSSPIHIDGKLYAMLNLDSGKVKAFSHYDRNLVAILTHEAANAISLYQKTHKINMLANFDSLTGLYNRQRFEALAKEWTLKPHFGSYLVLIDIDNLKTINDHHGHQAGDAALQKVSRLLKAQWHQKQLVARYGGDEFIALCHGPLERIESEIIAIETDLSEQGAVSFSYGIEQYNGQWNKTLKAADEAMYRNKRGKK